MAAAQTPRRRWDEGVGDAVSTAATLRCALERSHAKVRARDGDADALIRELCEARVRANEVISLASMLWESGLLLGPRGHLPVLRVHLLRRSLQRCCHASQRSALHLWRRRCLLQRSLEEFLKKNKLSGPRELRQWISPATTPRTVYRGPPPTRRAPPRNAPVPSTTSWEEALATPRADEEEARVCARLRAQLAEAHEAARADAETAALTQQREELARKREADILEECAQLRRSLQAVEQAAISGAGRPAASSTPIRDEETSQLKRWLQEQQHQVVSQPPPRKQ